MLTYGKFNNSNYHIDRVEQTDEKIIKAYEKADKIICALSDEQFNELLTAIGDYVTGIDTDGNDANIVTAKATIKRYGLTYKAAEIWYCHDEY